MTNRPTAMIPRLPYLDALRGFAILLVVLGHAIQYTVSDFDHNWAFRWIYSLHMPLFFALSGYVTKPLTAALRGQWNGPFVGRLQDLLVPYVVWLPVCYAVAHWVQQSAGFTGSMTEFAAQLPRSPDLGLWFLLVLAECRLLWMVCSAAGDRALPWLGAAALLLMNLMVLIWPGSNLFGLGLLRWYFLFFLLGHLLRGIRSFPPPPGATGLALVAYAVLASYWYRKSAVPVEALMQARGEPLTLLLTQGYHAITAIAGIFGLFGLFAALSERRWFAGPQRVLGMMGMRSLQVYVGHYAFLHATIGVSAGWALPTWARVGVVATVALCGALLLSLWIERSTLFSRLLYGQRRTA